MDNKDKNLLFEKKFAFDIWDDATKAKAFEFAEGYKKFLSYSKTERLAVKWAKYGIRVNAVAPGTIDTPMTAPMHGAPELVASEIGHIPAGRMGSVDEIAPTIAFLCTAQSSYTSGAVFVVDGASDCV